MTLKMVVLDLEMSKRAKRIAAAVLVPALVLAGGAIAYADTLHLWKDGETLDAADLNDNFTKLNAAVTALQQAAAADPFLAAMQGTYPAVVGGSETYNTSMAGFSCGAPTSLLFDVPDPMVTSMPFTGVANGAFGHVVFTRGGAFDLSQGYLSPGATTWNQTPFATNGTPCVNLCYGPVTFFLSSPAPQAITLKGYADDGPSPIYVNGAVVVPDATPNLPAGGQPVSIPAGSFSLSFEACSANGASVALWIDTAFITQYGLSVDFDSTFHRNGK